MSATARRVAGLVLLIPLYGAGVLLLRAGIYGWTLFAVIPVLLGGLAAWVFRSQTGWDAFRSGALTVMGASCVLLLTGWEGFLCVMLALPLTMLLGGFGSWLVYQSRSSALASRGLTMLLLLPPATLTWDAKAPAPVYAVSTEVEVAAAPEQVWKHVVSFPELPEPTEWYFRAGVAYPMRARIDVSGPGGEGPGAIRYCEFSTGAFVEPIEVWDAPRLLRFGVTENPAPMREWSPYGPVEARHLHGYLVAKQGQFRLTRLANGHTLLEGTTMYQHGLWPAGYWRVWSDAIIHRIHRRVLNHVRVLAEKEGKLPG